MKDLKPFLDDMLSMSTGTDGRTLEIHFSRPVTKDDRQALADAHNAIVRGQLVVSDPAEIPLDAAQELRDAAVMIRTWIPVSFPANEHGQVHFVRAVVEAVADTIERAIGQDASKPKGISDE